MKISYRQPRRTADISSAKGTAFSELWKLFLCAVVLLVGLYFLWGLAVDAVVSAISSETEAKIFKHFKPDIPAIEDPAALANLKKAQAILRKLKADPQVPELPYQLVLMDQKMPNAFAIPGGSIGVTTGLLDVVSDEIEIAFVIGHELGHFKNRDHLQGLGRAAGYHLMMALLFDIGAGSEVFNDIVGFVVERNYSQKRESAADRFGLELVYHVYGRVDGADRLFKMLLEDPAIPEWAYMFATHPAPRNRIMALMAYGAELTEGDAR